MRDGDGSGDPHRSKDTSRGVTFEATKCIHTTKLYGFRLLVALAYRQIKFPFFTISLSFPP